MSDYLSEALTCYQVFRCVDVCGGCTCKWITLDNWQQLTWGKRSWGTMTWTRSGDGCLSRTWPSWTSHVARNGRWKSCALVAIKDGWNMSCCSERNACLTGSLSIDKLNWHGIFVLLTCWICFDVLFWNVYLYCFLCVDPAGMWLTVRVVSGWTCYIAMAKRSSRRNGFKGAYETQLQEDSQQTWNLQRQVSK